MVERAPGNISEDAVQHVHLSLSSSGRMKVAWSMPKSGGKATHGGLIGSKPVVRYAPFGEKLGKSSAVMNAQSVLDWRGRWWNEAELERLRQGETYLYQCSSDIGGGQTLGRVRQMRAWSPNTSSDGTAEGKRRPLRIAIVGDLAEGRSGEEVVARIRAGPTTDAVLHLGDAAGNLTDENFQKGDRFLHMIEPVASAVPYMALLGDRDDLSVFRRFFHMPESNGNPWYTFNAGAARIVALWTESLVSLPGSDWNAQKAGWAKQQLLWLDRVLEHFDSAAERRLRPWVVVAGHRPVYCSVDPQRCGNEAKQLRAVLEPIFIRHHVDLYLSAHVHAYERTMPVQSNRLCRGSSTGDGQYFKQPCAPIFVVNGDAGTPALQYDTLPAPWTAHRQPGMLSYGELNIHNRTHLQYRQVQASSARVSDEFWLIKILGNGQTAVELEEDFLEAASWLAFATAIMMMTVFFIRWVHGDGLKRREEAHRNLQSEVAVLSGLPPRPLGASTAQESEQLVQLDQAGKSTDGLH